MEQKIYQRSGYGSTAAAVVSLFMLAPAVLANAYPSGFFSKVNGNIANPVAVAGLALLVVSLIALGVSQGKVKIDEQLREENSKLELLKDKIEAVLDGSDGTITVRQAFERNSNKEIVVKS